MPSAQELREAAIAVRDSAEERLATILKYVSHGGVQDRALRKTLEQQKLVAEAFLAEHLADDGDAINDQWLTKKLGCPERYVPRVTCWCIGNFTLAIIKLEFNGSYFLSVAPGKPKPYPNVICGLKTRGDVRRLREALGIELKESDNA